MTSELPSNKLELILGRLSTHNAYAAQQCCDIKTYALTLILSCLRQVRRFYQGMIRFDTNELFVSWLGLAPVSPAVAESAV
jgi:hypothetical protein